MPTFFPPVVYDGPRFHPDDPPFIKRARSYYRADPRGINVWALNDNTVTQVQPNDPALIKREYLGAHYHPVTDNEAAVLVSAGYYVDGYSAPVPSPPADPTPSPIPDNTTSGYGGGYGQGF